MMIPRTLLKPPSVLLPSHSSLSTSKRIGMHVFYGNRLTSILSPAPAAAEHGGVSSAGQSMEGPVSDRQPGTTFPGPSPLRVITTLDPSRLDSSCFMDISNISASSIYQTPPHKKRLLLFKMPYITVKNKPSIRFPAGTHGFLYFYVDPSEPLESQLRFRVTESDNPESFAQGSDLMYGPGLPFHFLVQDGLVDEALMAELKQRPAVRRKKTPKRALTKLDQPFVYDLAVGLYSMRICAPRSQRFVYQMFSPLRFKENQQGLALFKEGALECRFERSTLPEHAGRRVVLMRLLKILEPPVPIDNPPARADLTVPAEGELFTVRGRLWQRDLDHPCRNLAGLRLLFDADDQQMSG